MGTLTGARAESSFKLALLTAQAVDIDPRPRSLYISQDTTITLVDEDDVTSDPVPVFAGAILPVQPKQLTIGTGVFGFF